MLRGLAGLDRAPDEVLVIDNASTDRTPEVLEACALPGLRVVRPAENLGGAGGFHLGLRLAHEAGHDRVWLMDDDVVPAPDCLDVLLAAGAGSTDALMAVREDRSGALVEKAALRFDLRNPLAVKPKTAMVETTYGTREAMPERVALENVAFEGFLVHRATVEAIGLPDPSFFIFYDDCDYAIRARRAGFGIWAVRDARLVRQLDFDQQHDLAGWKGFYMFRNLFVVHQRYGENLAVRLKPWLITLAVLLLAPVQGGSGQARNVLRALRSSRGMRHVPDSARRAGPPASLQ
ncbi:hypothetical protein LUZ63_020051 [Rhynchospora breviuscula]|uniref:Glycosyltransferase 2-like domain-containing protein n=1 Tax=Rhynchospora breviuscula TaxID=2022672 RepID=A0A9Q0C028_9POAL|nr:hypothetical protein LUZ63_020051 [Rhynchospora breviuscula]